MRKFPLRGLLRGVFVMPMMATPVAIALVWTMMFHPQLGVLNYLLSLVGIPAAGMDISTPAPSSPRWSLVETWQWTPLVMLIVLGGLASRAARALRKRRDRRRQCLAEVPLPHAADDRAVPHGRRDDPHASMR